MKRIPVLTVCGALLLAATAHAVGISGDVGVTALATDAPTLVDEPVTRVPIYQTLNLKAGDIADERLSFEGSFRSWYDVYGDASDESDFRVLRSFVRWNDRDARLDARVGRQFVSEGVGRTYLDGVYVRKGFGRDHETSVFVGQPIIGINSPITENNGASQWGLHYRYRGVRNTNLGISFTELNESDGTALRLVGTDAVYRRTMRETIRFRFDVDAANLGVDRMSVRWNRQLEGGHLLSASTQYRQARLWVTNPLRDITSGHYVQATVSGMYALERNTRVYLALSGVNTGAALGTTVDLGLNWYAIRAGYLFASNGAVLGNSFYVQGSHRVFDNVLVGGRTNLGYYELDRADDTSHSIGSAVFTTITPIERLDITAEVQHVTNDAYKYQFQGLISARYRFSRISN